ncbi:MAG: hypothetical protein OEU36_22475 [Gammaproteobacteria bacterium]|nr:hypothetical protein [Gammaproteobacteria bacterium]
MRNHMYGALLVLLTAAPGCGPDERGADAQQTIDETKSPVPIKSEDPISASIGMISEAAIATCGGFTSDDAAAVLGLSAGAFEDRSEIYSSKSSLCSFMIPGTADGIGFYLVASGSIERAIAEMEMGRGMAGIAQENIDRASETTSLEPPLQSVSGIGEEAYFMEANGSLMVRVGNVQIQVLHMEEPKQMQEVGRMVAEGLQNN